MFFAYSLFCIPYVLTHLPTILFLFKRYQGLRLFHSLVMVVLALSLALDLRGFLDPLASIALNEEFVTENDIFYTG